ncbi:LacI family DNA-binding transcriptional regulator [Mycetocola sp. 2940]|uniref:LacI family DNA-binding transcriptional regulator n=1 Tax=Mycetocola sp. 2940 TaxID=3156452 RepID=UPI0033926513
MVNSRDVARAAGVSQATVSRVMTPGTPVSDATRARVLQAMAAVGYQPNLAAQTMKTGRTGTVGVVVADLTNPFYPQILDALSDAFDEAGYRMTVWVADSAKNDAALLAIRQGSVDGVVFTTVTETSSELHGALERQSPLVLVNRTLAGVDCDQVGSDNVAGGALVADYLVRHGRTRPAFIGGTPLATTSQGRLHGFATRLAELGHPLSPDRIFQGEYTHRNGYAAMARALDGSDAVDSVFCSNDLLAFGAIDAARSAGTAVPDDIWIIGYDDTDMASWESFDLTTVRQDIAGMAGAATRMLLARIQDPAAPAEQVVLESRLVIRGSTAHQPA